MDPENGSVGSWNRVAGPTNSIHTLRKALHTVCSGERARKRAGTVARNHRPLRSTHSPQRRGSMELRRLGRSGLKVSALSLGARTFGESQTFMKGVTSSDDEARRVFDRAIDAGVNLVDTANVYSERRSEVL